MRNEIPLLPISILTYFAQSVLFWMPGLLNAYVGKCQSTSAVVLIHSVTPCGSETSKCTSSRSPASTSAGGHGDSENVCFVHVPTRNMRKSHQRYQSSFIECYHMKAASVQMSSYLKRIGRCRWFFYFFGRRDFGEHASAGTASFW